MLYFIVVYDCMWMYHNICLCCDVFVVCIVYCDVYWIVCMCCEGFIMYLFTAMYRWYIFMHCNACTHFDVYGMYVCVAIQSGYVRIHYDA